LPTKHQPLTALQARQHLMNHGQLPGHTLHPLVERSWQRSLAAGLSPDRPVPSDTHQSGTALRETLQYNHHLLAHARPVMEFLFEQVRHFQNVVVLSDKQGTLVHTLGDPLFLNKTARVALALGASWNEAHRGTNAIGTTLAEGAGVEIHGAEHFLQPHEFLTCAAAPILAYDGSLLGVLDVSGDVRDGHPHTLGLVRTAAHLIENQLLLSECKRQVRVHLHAQAEGIGSVAEGIVVVSDSGWIVGANPKGLALLHMHRQQLGTTHWDGVVADRLHDLLGLRRMTARHPMPVRLHNGRTLFARADAPEPIAVHAPVPDIETIEPQHDALSALDTGDAKWRQAASKARRVLDKSIPVLIEGESGVGKEVFARAWHDSSLRQKGPFVAINCAAIPANLIEAELFGYQAGAYTGSRKDGSPGLLRQAEGGTLFLDEIGDMPLPLQTRLLRVLQERRVSPLGDGASVPVDFALVCATHANLRRNSGTGDFREDLFYRINGLTLRLPPLRERSDLDALIQKILRQCQPTGKLQMAEDVLAGLHAYPWPGNLRQLHTVLRTATAMLGPDEQTIGWNHLPDDLVEELLEAPGPAQSTPPATPEAAPQNLQQLSKVLVQQALDRNAGNISQAARELGISRQTLYKKMSQR